MRLYPKFALSRISYRGSTLLELMIGVTLSLLIFGATIVTLNQGFSAFRLSQEKTKAQEAAKIASEKIAVYVRSASQSPTVTGAGGTTDCSDNNGKHLGFDKGKKKGFTNKKSGCENEILSLSRRNATGGTDTFGLQQSNDKLILINGLSGTAGYTIKDSSFDFSSTSGVGNYGVVSIGFVTGENNTSQVYTTSVSPRLTNWKGSTACDPPTLSVSPSKIYIGGTPDSATITATSKNCLFSTLSIDDVYGSTSGSSTTAWKKDHTPFNAGDTKTSTFTTSDAGSVAGTYYFLATGDRSSGSSLNSGYQSLTVSPCSKPPTNCSYSTTTGTPCDTYSCCPAKETCSDGSTCSFTLVNGCNTYDCSSCPTVTPTPIPTGGDPPNKCCKEWAVGTKGTCPGDSIYEGDCTNGSPYCSICRDKSGYDQDGTTPCSSITTCSTPTITPTSCPSPPAKKTCNDGTTSCTEVKDSNGCVTGYDCSSCPINPKCGNSHGQILSLPPTDLCESGDDDNLHERINSNKITGWDWECKGINGGGTVSCYANLACDYCEVLVVGARGCSSSSYACAPDPTKPGCTPTPTPPPKCTDCKGKEHICAATTSQSDCNKRCGIVPCTCRLTCDDGTSSTSTPVYSHSGKKDPCDGFSKTCTCEKTSCEGTGTTFKKQYELTSTNGPDQSCDLAQTAVSNETCDVWLTFNVSWGNNLKIRSFDKSADVYLFAAYVGTSGKEYSAWKWSGECDGCTNKSTNDGQGIIAQWNNRVKVKKMSAELKTDSTTAIGTWTIDEIKQNSETVNINSDVTKVVGPKDIVGANAWRGWNDHNVKVSYSYFYAFSDSDTRASNFELSGKKYHIAGYRLFGNFSKKSPIILDLAGIGIPDVANGDWLPHEELFDRSRARVFDVTGEGFFILTEWVGPNSGILCTLDENGKVSSALQLFGTAGGWSDGYEKLSKLFDKDKNGIVEKEELDGLYVWHDRNMDAIATPDELQPVQKWGITKIWTKHDHYRSIFERNGKKYFSWDWWPSVTLIKPEDRNELLKGADIRKMHFKVRPIENSDVQKMIQKMIQQQNQTKKQKAQTPKKVSFSGGADRKTDPIQLPYMIAAALEYSAYHKKKKGWNKNGRGVFGS